MKDSNMRIRDKHPVSKTRYYFGQMKRSKLYSSKEQVKTERANLVALIAFTDLTPIELILC